MDTFTINEKLLASDFTPNQAKGATAVIAESASDERSAAKADMAKLETKLESDTAGMATKLDIAELKTNIAELETRLTNRLLSVAALIIATVALFGFFGQ